jgi:hypothetical protein
MEFVIITDEFPAEEESGTNRPTDEIPQTTKLPLSPLGLATGSSGREDGSESVMRSGVANL